MPPSAVILDRDVRDGGCAVLAEVVRKVRVEPADRVEAIEDVDPITAHRIAGEPQIAAPPRLQLVLDFVQAERAAERNEAVNPGALRDPLQAVIGDYGPHAVGNHDMRPRADRRAYGVDEALPDGALDRHGCAARRSVDNVEKIMMDIAQEGIHDSLFEKPGERHALERPLRRYRHGWRFGVELVVRKPGHVPAEHFKELGLRRCAWLGC